MAASRGMVTEILSAVDAGDAEASTKLLPIVYEELRKLARSLMAKTPPGNTLQPTALVHEAYLRLGTPEDQRDRGGIHGHPGSVGLVRLARRLRR